MSDPAMSDPATSDPAMTDAAATDATMSDSTTIDDLLATAFKTKDAADHERFLRALPQATLYVAFASDTMADANGILQPGAILSCSTEVFDEVEYPVVYTSVEVLTKHMTSDEGIVPHAIQSGTLAELLDHIGANDKLFVYGSRSSGFMPDPWLLDAIRAGQPLVEEPMSMGGPFTEPSQEPSHLVEPLKVACATCPSIAAAYRVMVKKGNEDVLLLVFDGAGMSDDEARVLSHCIMDNTRDGEMVLPHWMSADEPIAAYLTKHAKPFYQRRKKLFGLF